MASHERRRLVALGTLLAVVGTLVLAPTAMATFPGRNGLITFMREDADGFWQTWVARSDLTHARQLTSTSMRSSGWSVWSPDGSQIAFDSDRADPEPGDDIVINDIFTMSPNGRGIVKLTDSIGFSGDPSFSPDGRLIAFETDLGDHPAKQGIYVMKAADGSQMRRVTTLPTTASFDGAPRFSPNGRKLVFTRYRDGFTKPNGDVVDPTSALFIVRLDGSGLVRVTPWRLRAGDGDWSPDGTRIVFEADLVDGRGDAWIVGDDGRGLRNLTYRAPVPGMWEGFADPVWSPDGTLILFLNGRHFDDGTVTAGLATIRPDGTHLKYLGDGLGIEHQPDWGTAEPWWFGSVPLD